MKFIIASAICLLSICVSAQEPLTFSEVVPVDSATQAQLFTNARRWINDAFKSGKAVTEIQDKETGELTGNAVLTVKGAFKSTAWYRFEAPTSFKFRIQVKDGKYKYAFTNFVNDAITPTTMKASYKPAGLLTTAESPVLTGWGKKNQAEAWNSMNSDLREQINSLIQSLKAAMVKTDNF